jgi:hypothetical protein
VSFNKYILILLVLLVGHDALAAKKRARKLRKRKPASAMVSKVKKAEAPVTEVLVFSENTDFEQLLDKKERGMRDPASLLPKARVIGVRREIGFTEEITQENPQDIILNVGAEGGMSEGMTLTVGRKIPILDPYQGNRQKEMTIPFASVTIVHADKEIAIARIVRILPASKTAYVGIRSIMIGDYVGDVSN